MDACEWDEAKRKRTLDERGVDFADIERFDWASALTVEDIRRAYAERRFVSIGKIDGRLHACAWRYRGGKIRVISLRRANARERGRYEQASG